MSNKEILTLQIGHYSNFVGAHWWNLQEQSFSYSSANTAINHDCLYRQGKTLNNQVTFTPRLLLTDLKSALKTLPECGELYQHDEAFDEHCSTSYEVIKEPPAPKNEFLAELASPNPVLKPIDNLNAQITVWSDYLYARFHPRTVNVVKHDENFNAFQLGVDCWRQRNFDEDFTDKIRLYVEECDYFSGFQLIYDATNAFAGLATQCLQYLDDEYATKARLTFPTLENGENSAPIGQINYALGLDQAMQFSDLVIPLSTPSNLTPDTFYHSSAILAAYLETMTSCYRMKAHNYHLVELTSHFAKFGRKVAAASLKFPLNLQDSFFIDYLNDWNESSDISTMLTPKCEQNSTDRTQMHQFTLRGIGANELKSEKNVKHREMPAFRCESAEEMFHLFLQYQNAAYSQRTKVISCPDRLQLHPPYPLEDLSAGAAVASWAGVHSGKFVGEMLDQQVSAVKPLKLGRFNEFQDFDSDEFGEACERLLQLKDCYFD